MKSDRRKFIQNLGAGAAGLTLGTSAISLTSGTSSSVKRKMKTVRYFLLAITLQ